jgi:Repeat of unknown function (DUF5907)
MSFVIHNNTHDAIVDARECSLPITGGTMKGRIRQPFVPISPNDLVNKVYVDAVRPPVQVPDATSSTKGVVQLAGDLTGEASAPVIGAGRINNSKLASGQARTLKGTDDSTNVVDLSTSADLLIEGSILSLNKLALAGSFVSISGATMTGQITQPLSPADPKDLANMAYVDSKITPDATGVIKGKILLAGGDLTGTADSVLVRDKVIGNTKLTDMTGPSQLKGSANSGPEITDISLGNRLTMVGSVLSVIDQDADVFVQFTGGIDYPEVQWADSSTLNYGGALKAYVRYTVDGSNYQNVWSWEPGSYTPVWTNGKTQQVAYVAIIPDVENKSFKIVEYGSYRDFPSRDAAHVIFYSIATRDVDNGVLTSVISYMQGYTGIDYADKINIFYKGSIVLYDAAYLLTPDTDEGLGSGSYYRLNGGSAKTAGRNYLYDKFSTFVVIDDPEIRGGAKEMTVALAGRGTEGNEGKQFYRASGSEARILGSCGQVVYEPAPANSPKEYATVEENKWTYYRLVVFPGSRLVVAQPHDDAKFESADEALATTHVYDKTPYRTFDRWIPAIFVGYVALKGSFNFNSSWAKNDQQYAFYDYNKMLMR